jgi:hypothetical protein
MQNIDETMSQDTAFATENNGDDTFKFDEAEVTSPDSQSKEEQDDSNESKEDDSDVAEDKENEENKIPYSRFKKVVDERNETASKIEFLEERLQELENNRIESTKTNLDEVQMPSEWVELYGDSDVAKRAWIIQQKREDDIAERAVSQAVDRLRQQQEDEVSAVAENEIIIDENLNDLQEQIGRQLTSKQEEEILTIVDEFSPVGKDGKYLTLFPFDKAYEIYTLRQSQKGLGTRQARQTVADLTGNTSEGEADPNESTFKRGWDNWREAI